MKCPRCGSGDIDEPCPSCGFDDTTFDAEIHWAGPEPISATWIMLCLHCPTRVAITIPYRGDVPKAKECAIELVRRAWNSTAKWIAENGWSPKEVDGA